MTPYQKAKTLTIQLSSFTKEEIIGAAINTAHSLNLPIAVWRMPKSSEIRLAISTHEAKELRRIDLDDLKAGFVVAPFHFGTESSQFIEAHFCLSLDFDEVINERVFEVSDDLSKLEEIKNSFESFLMKESHDKSYHLSTNDVSENLTDYKSLVAESIAAINAGQFEKVVPARSKRIDLPKNFDPVRLFLDLCDNYHSAFVSFVSIPKHGTWMGATPEVLIEKTDTLFKTTALAGTQKANASKSIGDISWTQKEIEEQAMVSRYIINCFKKIRLREYDESGPKTIQAGNLLHLKTSYIVNTKETNFPELATVMLELLHPTSAVAGMPKDSALNFINEREGLKREFFSGFLGPINLEGKSNLFVNLRCMQLLEKQAILYAGAGVTSDSNPEKEYQETEIKFKTLLNVLNQQT